MSSTNSTPSKEVSDSVQSVNGETCDNNSNTHKDSVQFNDMLLSEGSNLEANMENLEVNKKSKSVKYQAEKLASILMEYGDLYNYNKNYKLASTCYQQGLNLDYPNYLLRFELLSKLSASQFLLEDYRSCLETTEQLLKLAPDYNIAIPRAIKCCIQLKDYLKSVFFYQLYTNKFNGSTMEEQLESDAFCNEVEILHLLYELNQRKLNVTKPFNKNAVIEDMTLFKPKYEHFRPVHLIYNRLIWPVVFEFLEFRSLVLINHFHEDTRFHTELVQVSLEKEKCGISGEFDPEKINVYYVCPINPIPKLRKIDSKTCSLSDALTLLKCPIEYGSPNFKIFVAGGLAEKAALADYRKYISKINDE